MSAEHSTLRLPKLKKPADYLPWKRQVYAYIRQSDTQLKCFQERPEGNQRLQTAWDDLNAKAKSVIVLTL